MLHFLAVIIALQFDGIVNFANVSIIADVDVLEICVAVVVQLLLVLLLAFGTA
jgi:hypothetical protein